MNAALGGVSAGGIGTPASDVTQSGGGPCAFVAIQPEGSAGGETLSKSSIIVSRNQQGKHGSGLGVSTRLTLTFSGKTNPSPCWPIAREELIAPNTANTAATETSR